jgi:hypothetical protein
MTVRYLSIRDVMNLTASADPLGSAPVVRSRRDLFIAALFGAKPAYVATATLPGRPNPSPD